jgi:molybdopterin/thiamine biosynthesis adenylyltransferase/rhodanese-related sulfurtransferase
MSSTVDLTVQQAYTMAEEGAAFIDIRRIEEVANRSPRSAFNIPRDMLEVELTRQSMPKQRQILLLCQSGVRSRYAAQALRHFGWENAWSVAGGFLAWDAEQKPVSDVPYLDTESRKRFARHLSLAEVGVLGQAKLAQARIAIVGAGGLGTPAALYLTAMGVGYIRLIDHDVVELSNLQRQVLHSETSIGISKVKSASAMLNKLNGRVVIDAVCRRFDETCGDLISDVDLVINGADNFDARYLLNDLCLASKVPMIDGAVLEMEGQLSVFCHPDGGPCYRCLYPEPPPQALAPSCVAAGVLGVVPGTIGVLQALEAAKLIVGFGEPLIGKILGFDARTSEFNLIHFDFDPTCTCCSIGHF